MTAIDETDQRILTMLEADGRATLAQLAQATGLSVSAAQSRVQKLEKRGIIKGYKAIIDQEQRGLPISAFVNVTPLDYSAESSIPDKASSPAIRWPAPPASYWWYAWPPPPPLRNCSISSTARCR